MLVVVGVLLYIGVGDSFELYTAGYTKLPQLDQLTLNSTAILRPASRMEVIRMLKISKAMTMSVTMNDDNGDRYYHDDGLL